MRRFLISDTDATCALNHTRAVQHKTDQKKKASKREKCRSSKSGIWYLIGAGPSLCTYNYYKQKFKKKNHKFFFSLRKIRKRDGGSCKGTNDIGYSVEFSMINKSEQWNITKIIKNPNQITTHTHTYTSPACILMYTKVLIMWILLKFGNWYCVVDFVVHIFFFIGICSSEINCKFTAFFHHEPFCITRSFCIRQILKPLSNSKVSFWFNDKNYGTGNWKMVWIWKVESKNWPIKEFSRCFRPYLNSKWRWKCKSNETLNAKRWHGTANGRPALSSIVVWISIGLYLWHIFFVVVF